jgi:hypothetical protein
MDKIRSGLPKPAVRSKLQEESTMRHLLLACGAAAVMLAGTATAKAGDYGLSYGFYPSLYRAYTTDKIPYFAAHPPVYYSHIVPRPYGWSPYAFPPGSPMPDVAPAPEPEAAPPVAPSSNRPALHEAKLTYSRTR